jgi:3-mercaptopyruvate sulfurtransferase SseA
MSRKLAILFTIWIVLLATSACSIQTGSPQSASDFPFTEAEVPRVTVQEAKAALDSGAAIIVDVRGSGSYETSHIAGAINIPLDEFEANPEGLNLDKDQWIITYCT